MSNQNYNKYYERPVAKEAVVQTAEVINDIVMAGIAEENDNLAFEEVPEAVEEVIKETPAKREKVFGVIVDCAKLNVRAEANTGASVLYTVDRNGKLMVDVENSTDEWYSVCNKAGVSGYAMKKYISVKQ